MSYETSLKDDISLLKVGADLSVHARSAISYRVLEKQILKQLAMQLRFAAFHVKFYSMRNMEDEEKL